MKRINKYFAILFAACFTFTACNDDFLNTKPLGEVDESSVWTDIALAEAFVVGIYQGLGNGGFDEQMLASLTDESMFTHPGRGITTITEARSNPADIGWVNGTLAWSSMYSRIRATNIAIEKLTDEKFPHTGASTDRLIGEAKFMRAYYYHQVLRYYGGFPIIDYAYTLDAETFLAPRNTFEECVNFIVKDLDEAATLLTGQSAIRGRATKTSALALKSRVLLYAASDLHDGPTAKAKSADLAAYGNLDLLAYPSGNRTERWQKAQAAAKAVLDAHTGNQMGLTAPVDHATGVQNYINNSMARNGGEAEILLGRYFINLKQENGGRQGLFNGPNGYNNWAGNTPVQSLIDDYEMMDGTKFSWSNPAHSSAPYVNREARFYASVLYDGAQWKPRSSANQPRDPLGQIQTGTYEITGGTGTHFGLDTRNSPIEDWNGSYTGYYFRKFIDANPAIVDQNTWQQVPWPVLRYTEAVLNYVEASIELGQEAEAKAWLNQIRYRVGLPAITETGDALKQRYRNERRIEMAYEEQRYHDVRRWMIAPVAFNRQANGISITGTFKPGKSLSVYRYDPTIYNYVYKVIDMDPGKENRKWLDKMYYLPIHRDEMNRNSELVQNPGYTQ
ncbi:RagB/SusD family nutrient uptake outer membrane protein [Algoriphagus sp. H41]|uniref:RagB/SusD family nutrient uptake outer membrane protein n=1 Tax=Algoriphagus oliviformis TaxID=2811231 RepID=A0ABS3BZ26_9BACT|nr:RagB/SusD family nutrient uptake outer membrane protein [Algoriphagus oliviformis]MBN7810066.1 RagB/SusD family nutrient uptake outer membrane protein [Algoriphagus oliviformis]